VSFPPQAKQNIILYTHKIENNLYEHELISTLLDVDFRVFTPGSRWRLTECLYYDI